MFETLQRRLLSTRLVGVWAVLCFAFVGCFVGCIAGCLAGCNNDRNSGPDTTAADVTGDDGASVLVTYTEERTACADRNPQRNPYFGDLHVHTHFSFDAYVEGTRPGPADAYRFAQGEPLAIAPLDAAGVGTQVLRLEQPLDFAAVTDHAEFLGEVDTCTTAGAPGYEHARCVTYRAGDENSLADFGVQLTRETPQRLDICDDVDCPAATGNVWTLMQDAAEQAYDRSAACSFTSFVGYEWTSNTAARNLHRNVIFRNATVPALPTSYFEEPTPQGLWAALDRDCIRAEGDCSVLAIPHNSNLSNGGMFAPLYPGAASVADEQQQASTRAALEPVMEVFQHKGNSECNNGLSGILGDPDELCLMEAIRPPPFDDCGDDLGVLGIQGAGCVSRYDYARSTLLAGLQEWLRLGVNPTMFGFIGSTDTHNATPGATREDGFLGHTGNAEALPEDRLSRHGLVPFGIVANPGGLAGIWAVENSRDALFEALVRREVWGTSGTRITPRLFGAWTLSPTWCADPERIADAYRDGVPMGATLGARPSDGAAPSFAVHADRDPSAYAGPLEEIQVIKGWVAADGAHYKVFSAVHSDDPGSVDEATCSRTGGSASLCGVWTDPEFDPAVPAFYYARVVETPACRWSHAECITLPADQRPAACDNPDIATTIREMAWTSPIWYQP